MPDCDSGAFASSSSLLFDSHPGHLQAETPLNTPSRFAEPPLIAAALLHKPDLMIVDEGLRDGSGSAAVAEIALTGFVPHIFATGDRYRVLKVEPKAIVLQKPFDLQILERAIARALQPLASAG